MDDAALAGPLAAGLMGLAVGPALDLASRYLLARRHRTVDKSRKGLLGSALLACGSLAALALRYGTSPALPEALAQLSLLLVAALTDARGRIIPNEVVLGGVAAHLAFALAASSPSSVLLTSLAGGIALAGPALLVGLAIGHATGQTALGGGDVKLLFLVGLWLGPWRGIVAAGLSCVLGVCVSLAARKGGTFPLAPPIALSCLVVSLAWTR